MQKNSPTISCNISRAVILIISFSTLFCRHFPGRCDGLTDAAFKGTYERRIEIPPHLIDLYKE